MTIEQQEMLYAATVARDSGFKRVEIDPSDVIALFECIAQLEARVEELRRRYEPTMDEEREDMDARVGERLG